MTVTNNAWIRGAGGNRGHRNSILREAWLMPLSQRLPCCYEFLHRLRTRKAIAAVMNNGCGRSGSTLPWRPTS